MQLPEVWRSDEKDWLTGESRNWRDGCTSVQQYIVIQRMPHAERLLRDVELPVSRIAEMVGYRCIGSLSEMFRRHTGMKPTKYREFMRNRFFFQSQSFCR